MLARSLFTFGVIILAAPPGRAAESDALAITANIQARHLPFGAILDPIFTLTNSDQIAGYTRCGDSALWTGHYLAAEAFRYKVTQAPDALNNLKAAIAGLKGLADVTGTNLLARCMVPVDSPYAAGISSEEVANGVHTNSAAGWIWVGNTSRDEYCGALFGLAVAYDMVTDAAIKSSISDLVTRLVEFLNGNNWSVVMPDGSSSTSFLVRPDQIETFLAIGRHVNSDHFSSVSYETQRVLLATTVPAPIGVDTASDSSYFKFNLDYIDLYNLIRLEASSAKTIYQSAYTLLRDHTAPHQNAFFNIIDLALNGANTARDSQTLALLDAWLLRLRRDFGVDLSSVVPVCGDQACQPVPVWLRPPTDFLWQRSPFQLAVGGAGIIESAGIDYILPYWMARYYGLQESIVVQSAAAGIAVVAPQSLGSIFGANLASTTHKSRIAAAAGFARRRHGHCPGFRRNLGRRSAALCVPRPDQLPHARGHGYRCRHVHHRGRSLRSSDRHRRRGTGRARPVQPEWRRHGTGRRHGHPRQCRRPVTAIPRDPVRLQHLAMPARARRRRNRHARLSDALRHGDPQPQFARQCPGDDQRHQRACSLRRPPVAIRRPGSD